MNRLYGVQFRLACGLLTLGFTAVVLLILAACGTGSAGPPAPAVAPGGTGPHVLSFTSFSSQGAWALTERGLRRTEDGGGGWADVTPPQLQGRSLSWRTVAFFRDDLLGWLASFEPAGVSTSVSIFRTSDGGKTWGSAQLELDASAGQYAGTGSLFFLDENAGWLMARLQTSSAASKGVLYRTSNGGSTWAKAEPPIGGALVFTSPSDGWVAGGPTGGQLYVTRDGGATWAAQQVPHRSVEKPWLTTVAAPRFFDSSNGVLSVQVRSETVDRADHYYFVTHDGGNSWQEAGPPLQTAAGKDFFSAVDASNWLILADKLYITRDGGRDWSAVDTVQDFLYAVSIDFATAEEGWAYFEKTTCPDKVNCLTGSLLLRTQDGGQTWLMPSALP